eukprot:12144570-Ditylum_brightwellii.AAC.1
MGGCVWLTVKWHIGTIFGAICVVVIAIVIVIVAISCVKPKTQPTLPPNYPKPPQTSHFPPSNNKNTTISSRVSLQAPAGHNCPVATLTMATHCRCQMLVPLS